MYVPAPVSPVGVIYLVLLPAHMQKALKQREAGVCSLPEKGGVGRGGQRECCDQAYQGPEGGGGGQEEGCPAQALLAKFPSPSALGTSPGLTLLQDKSGLSPRHVALGEKGYLSPETCAALARNDKPLIY